MSALTLCPVLVSRVDSLHAGKVLPAMLSHKDKFIKVEEIPEPSMYFDHDYTASKEIAMPPEPKMPPQKAVFFKLQVKNDASPFTRALGEYIKRREKKSKTSLLITDLQSSPKPPSKQDVNNALKQLEREPTDSAVTRNIRKVLRPVITVLADYSGVVDTMIANRMGRALSSFITSKLDVIIKDIEKNADRDLTDLKKLLKDCAVIEVTEDTNSADIELYLSKSVLKLDSLDLDEGYQNLILQDLRQKADGCFLWASLMLDSVPSAVTLSAVQYQVQEGLPKDYENYYQNKIDKIEASQKPFVSKILACIVYARRPLRLDELCESIAILDACDCDNVDKSQRLFRSLALKLCEPLVQIEDVDTAHGKISTCTLTHGSVPQFLVKHPQCLSRSETLACHFRGLYRRRRNGTPFALSYYELSGQAS
ncbi:hypothetical protein BPOR_0158g00060 [Botrytis porri]|uniref:NACHT-NTPase and P-loop NTPases N-terminal domain-containing protein n=1 Tax=Botrytis porri TaxID=87229 RepID=A0A4Z1KVM7_9HELO|nr:hypothetical protein BPOR_0158g00060 [Botrytis porri]